MKSRLPLFALCLACASPARAELDLDAWLYYSMYSGDHSHAVHLAALKQRPDGLLESASRYPRHRDESWTEEESARGWYNYVPRLIDCETGLSIEIGDQLLDEEGQVIASRDTAERSLADWKKNLDNKLANHQWPVKNELFMACAAVHDEKLVVARKKRAQTPLPRLSYKPIIAGLREESTAVVERAAALRPVDVEKQGGGKTVATLFDAAARGYTAWLAGFGALPAPGARAAQPALSESRLAWLKGRGFDIDTVRGSGDGTLEYISRDPSRFDIPYSVLEQRPPVSENASQAALLQRLDCRTGFQQGLQVDWLDDQRALLARQVFPVDEMAPNLEQQIARFNQQLANVLAPSLQENGALQVCIAAAAQCNDDKPRIPEAFALKAADWKAVEAAPTAADALLVMREVYRNYRQRFVPNCPIGNPN